MTTPTLTTGGRNGAYWYGSYTDHAGTRQRRSLGRTSTVTERQAINKLDELAASPQPIATGPAPKLSAWLDRYLAIRPDYAPSTAELYRQAVKHLTKQTGDIRIDQLTRQHAAAYPPALIELGLQPATAHKHARCIKALLNEATDQDIITRNPFTKIRTPGKTQDSFDYVSDDSLNKMLDACPDQAWRTLIALTRLAGLRLSEALRLAWADVDWQHHTITVRSKAKHATTKDKTRTVPTMPKLYAILLTSFEQANPQPVGLTPYQFNGSTSTGYRTMQAIIDRAGVDRYAKPMHTLRKSLESDWLSTYPIMDVTRWLGHSPTVAAQHYHQTTPDTLARVTGQHQPKEQHEVAR